MNKVIVTVVVLLLVAAGFFFFSSSSEESTIDTTPEVNAIPETNTGSTEPERNSETEESETPTEPEATVQTKTFSLTGQNFKFMMNGVSNPDIVVNEGDTVRIEFDSTQGFHNWMVSEFSAATAQIRDTDEATFVEFVADKKGTFEYYCSVGSHRANGMKGKLIVQ